MEPPRCPIRAAMVNSEKPRSAATEANEWRKTCGVTSLGSAPKYAIFRNKKGNPDITMSSCEDGKTRPSSELGSSSRTLIAAREITLTLDPVLVSGRHAIRCFKSRWDHRNFSASPERHPVSAKKRAAAMALGQISFAVLSLRQGFDHKRPCVLRN